jgi:DNA-binding response OmpR family regulator
MEAKRTTPYSILLVGEQPALLRALHFRLEMAEYCVQVESCYRNAVETMGAYAFDLVINDVGSAAKGVDLERAAWIERCGPETPFIFLSAEDDAYEPMRNGKDWVVKPFDPEVLVNTVQMRLERIAEASA